MPRARAAAGPGRALAAERSVPPPQCGACRRPGWRSWEEAGEEGSHPGSCLNSRERSSVHLLWAGGLSAGARRPPGFSPLAWRVQGGMGATHLLFLLAVQTLPSTNGTPSGAGAEVWLTGSLAGARLQGGCWEQRVEASAGSSLLSEGIPHPSHMRRGKCHKRMGICSSDPQPKAPWVWLQDAGGGPEEGWPGVLGRVSAG